MKEIILIVVVFGLFIFFLWAFLKPQKKTKTPLKTENTKDKTKDEPPEILKEVTMGNYMYDMSHGPVVDGVEVVEDESIEIPVKEKVDNRTKIEKAFDEIIDIGNDYDDEIEEEIDSVDRDIDMLIEDIDEEFDDEQLIDMSGENKKNSVKKSLADEYRGLSKEMKAMLIANILEKKHKK